MGWVGGRGILNPVNTLKEGGGWGEVEQGGMGLGWGGAGEGWAEWGAAWWGGVAGSGVGNAIVDEW